MDGYAVQVEMFPTDSLFKSKLCEDMLVVQRAQGDPFSRDWLQEAATSLSEVFPTWDSNWDLVETFVHPSEIQLVWKPQLARMSKLETSSEARTW